VSIIKKKKITVGMAISRERRPAAAPADKELNPCSGLLQP